MPQLRSCLRCCGLEVDGTGFKPEPTKEKINAFLTSADRCVKALSDESNLQDLIAKSGLQQIVAEPQKLHTLLYMKCIHHMIAVATNEDEIKQITKMANENQDQLDKVATQVENAKKEMVKVVETYDKKLKSDQETKKKEEERKKAAEEREARKKAEKDQKDRAKNITVGGTPDMPAFSVVSSCIKPVYCFTNPAAVKAKKPQPDTSYVSKYWGAMVSNIHLQTHFTYPL